MERAVAGTPAQVDPAVISATAYQIWDKAGRPCGRDVEFWLEAEAQLQATREMDAAQAGGKRTSLIAPKSGAPPRRALVRR